MNDEIIVFELPNGSVLYSTCPIKGKKIGELKSPWLHRCFRETVQSNPELAGAKRIAEPIMPDGTSFRPGAPRMFYKAWRHVGKGQIEIDMPLARLQRMIEIRQERDVRLIAADGPTTREMEQNPTTTGWRTYKQALRDIPTSYDLETITTPEELDLFEPNWPIEPK